MTWLPKVRLRGSSTWYAHGRPIRTPSIKLTRSVKLTLRWNLEVSLVVCVPFFFLIPRQVVGVCVVVWQLNNRLDYLNPFRTSHAESWNTIKSGKQQRTVDITGLASKVASDVYFPKLCRTERGDSWVGCSSGRKKQPQSNWLFLFFFFLSLANHF